MLGATKLPEMHSIKQVLSIDKIVGPSPATESSTTVVLGMLLKTTVLRTMAVPGNLA